MKKIMNILAPVIAAIIILIAWELIVKGLHISEKLIPAPSGIWKSLIENFGPVIFKDLCISVKNIVIGYIIAVPV